MIYAYLGKDYDDNDLEGKVKVPFTIRDTATDDTIKFKFTVLKDMLRAETYCKNYFKDEFIKYGDVRSALNKIHAIRDEEKQDKIGMLYYIGQLFGTYILAQTDKELVVFRDSFGSSIAPLLTPYYNKIIMVDLRYMDFKFVKEKLNFENADVLFLYSTLIINSSDILKVNMK